MKIPSFLAITLLFLLSTSKTSLALQTTLLGRFDNAIWSKVINDPFDGSIVYDLDYDISRPSTLGITDVVSSWSKRDIRVSCANGVGFITTERVLKSILINGQQQSYYVDEKVRKSAIAPISLKFLIGGKIYIYSDGEVSKELSQALANAPPGDMFVRAVWSNTYATLRIGSQTVAAWKEIFKP